MANTSRRNPLVKERFLEGNRQRWVALGLIITIGVLVCNIIWKIDPAPYLQAVMLLIGAGVLGWSVDSAVKAYKVDSLNKTENIHEERFETVNIKEERLLQLTRVDPKDIDDEAFEPGEAEEVQ